MVDDDRELSDSEWQTEVRKALYAMRRAAWEERMKRAGRDTTPWVL